MAEGQIIVTGASRGIGAAIAVELTRRGRAVVGLSRGGESAGGQGIACDMTDEAAVTVAIRRIAEAGPVVGLVNNAGAHEATPTARLASAAFEATMRLNAVAVLAASREAYPHLKAAGGGLIVNIGSFFEKLGVPENVAYCASKAAVGAMTRCMAAEWAQDGIRVLNVAPGYIRTDLNRDFLDGERVRAWIGKRVPVGRPGTPDEVGRLVALLFESEIGFLTGETITIDGGQGHAH
jgi:NAD(P)-dependent dehydrogenase (short-subunit alcohol dehydrogenase family)